MIFCQANQSEVQEIVKILQVYAGASGQCINMEKSSLFFSGNTPRQQKHWIMDSLGVKEVAKFDTYLGLPMLIGRTKYLTFSNLKDKVWKKLQGWKGKMLSRAGKEVLIKAVAQSIPTYSMGVFQLPKKLCDELDSMCANFWWGQVGDERKIHWKGWSKLTEAKKVGGMGFRDLRSFNLAMLAKQGWRLIQEQESLMSRCFKAKYFPRTHFLAATDPPASSYVWKSIMAAKPILLKGCYWRVGDGSNISVLNDRWIPNHPTNRVIHPPGDEEWEWRVSELIDPNLKWWRRELIAERFHKDDAEAILRIPLSHRHTLDVVVWQHNKQGVYSVRSGYHVARQIMNDEHRVETSTGPVGGKLWTTIWKTNVPNKIKVFSWRACHDILPTRANLVRRKIIKDDACMLCSGVPETGVHAIWECAVAMDVWAGCLTKLQKSGQGQRDVLDLFHEMMTRLSSTEFKLFLVQSWMIWNQRNVVTHGGIVKDPRWLNNRAREFLDEFHQSREQLHTPTSYSGASVRAWQPPLSPVFKLNFDAAIFEDLSCSGVGAIIRNDKGEAMASMSARGPPVYDSEEAEILACRKAMEFATDAGFTELIVEGDNAVVMQTVMAPGAIQSRLGHIIQDIQWLSQGLRWVSFSCVNRGANSVAHVLARYAKHVREDMYWMEDVPPPALNALYLDYLQLNE